MMYSTIRLTTLLKTTATPQAGGHFGSATAALGYIDGGDRFTARLVSLGESAPLIRLKDRLLDDRYHINGSDTDGRDTNGSDTNDTTKQREGRHGHSTSVFRKD